jgi:hypothetical protein
LDCEEFLKRWFKKGLGKSMRPDLVEEKLLPDG